MQKVFSVLLVCSSVMFAEVKLSPAYSKCVNNAGGVTSSMLECNEKEYKVQDAKLNKMYKTAMSKLDPQGKTKLKNVQRIWVQYKEAKCGFYDGLSGGTMDALNSSGCTIEETALRAQELEGIVGML
jgi:uncharacterized protein YecT (DUF1311 family)